MNVRQPTTNQRDNLGRGLAQKRKLMSLGLFCPSCV